MTARTHLPALLIVGAAAAGVSTADAQSLRGSRASVNRMHRQAVTHDLHFYQTPAGVRRAAAGNRLARLSSGTDYVLHRVAYPYAKASTRTFAERLGRQYRATCGERLVITGAVRPATRQPWNASDRSVHPTGIALDLRKPSDTRCRAWLRRTLLSLEKQGVIEATEEYGPPHFHVAVFPTPYRRHVARLTGRGRSLAARGPDAARTYVVRSGDSLWEIARRHDTTVAHLKAANGLDGSRIRPGQALVLPGG